MSKKVYLTDVTGRDGFQMEKEWIETEEKISILNQIIQAGVTRIEATSFVSPKAIPQLKDAKEVISSLNRKGIELVTLVPNLKGTELAIEADVDEINFVVSISETHNNKNVNQSVGDSLEQIKIIHQLAIDHHKRLNISLGTTFGCPFEGIYQVDKVLKVMGRLDSIGVDRITLADTTGMANPKQIILFVKTLKAAYPNTHFSLHLHNTRGMGLTNLYAGYQAGIRHFDAAIGGKGGCPFAPGATGNVCLEDVAHMLSFMGIPIDPDVRKLTEAAKNLETLLGYQLPGQVMKAGLASDTTAIESH
ncbi:hydroxymethylglutaryl-CoA lyase [Oceanobacillus massiliensis]|uniref:hydroxymethylglutaryl-CoA lyase n=1 Tax=Oceanobacillus massiliensis TaxID=1465765 RepID=UPI0030189B0C